MFASGSRSGDDCQNSPSSRSGSRMPASQPPRASPDAQPQDPDASRMGEVVTAFISDDAVQRLEDDARRAKSRPDRRRRDTILLIARMRQAEIDRDAFAARLAKEYANVSE